MTMSRRLFVFAILTFAVSPIRAVEAPADTSPMVAKVGDQTLTEADMRKDLAFALYEAENQVYGLKKNWIDTKAKDILFTKAAKDAKMDRKAWEKKEIDDKIVQPTDAEVDQMVQNYSRGQMPTDPAQLQEMKKQARNSLLSQRRMARESALYTELTAQTPVQVVLIPPSAPDIPITYTKDNPVKGSKDAPITVMEFTDFQCPWCSRSQESVKALEKTYGDKVKFITRHFPLPMHPQAMPAAKAAVCAQEQGKFWPMHDKLFENQSALGEADLKRYAKDLGLNTSKFDKCLGSGRPDKIIAADMADGQRYGVRGTPTFFVNSQRANFNQLNDIVRAELEKKK